MKTYAFNEPSPQGNVVRHITDREIIKTFFPHWAKLMRKAGKAHSICIEHCIDDFITVHWAWEIKL